MDGSVRCPVVRCCAVRYRAIRHEMPTDRADPLAHQNIRDRFYGQDDPVAAKMMTKQDELPKLVPPEDEGISSLWLGNMSENITPEVIKYFFFLCDLCSRCFRWASSYIVMIKKN